MRKVFKLDEIDCAVCAGKLEEAIKKLDGVQDAKINFLTQKLTLVPMTPTSTPSSTPWSSSPRDRARLRDPALKTSRARRPGPPADRR